MVHEVGVRVADGQFRETDVGTLLTALVDGVAERGDENSENVDRIKTAFHLADEAHRARTRLTGEPYIVHPLHVGLILTELGMDSTTIAAGLLHDVLEDTSVEPEMIGATFGADVLNLVEGVTKLRKLVFYSTRHQQVENFRKLFVAMAQDVRVIVIKLADRLHNMRTLHAHSEENQVKTAEETRQVFAPLAHRLGIWRIKWELEDLSFRYMEPESYREIADKVSKTRRERVGFVDEAVSMLTKALENAGIEALVNGRPKHLWSIYEKMIREEVDFERIYDLLALRVIVDSIPDCYRALGIVHRFWQPIPEMFADFIANAKSNGYQSLHTKVMGRTGEPMEVQIRTEAMHREAAFGIAAHWKYKEGGFVDSDLEGAMRWLRHLMEAQTDLQDAGEFFESAKTDFFQDHVFAFSPKGEVLDLPVGSTVVDFAYRIHTELGHGCQGARVNGKMEALNHQIRSGDTVEIVVSEDRKVPSPDWLSFVKTSHARNNIKRYLNTQVQQDNVVIGRRTLEQVAQEKDVALDEVMEENKLQEISSAFHCSSVVDLLGAIGSGDISPDAVLARLRPMETVSPAVPPLTGVAVAAKDGEGQFSYRFSRCCSPIPGDPIVGYLTRGGGVAVHRGDCRNLRYLSRNAPTRVSELEWHLSMDGTYHAEVAVEAFDRLGLLNDITTVIAIQGVNIVSCRVRTVQPLTARLNIVVDVTGPADLQRVIEGIRRLSDVRQVFRVLR